MGLFGRSVGFIRTIPSRIERPGGGAWPDATLANRKWAVNLGSHAETHPAWTCAVDGVAQQLAVNAPGAVVTPGQPVLMSVPADGGIAIEAALQNKDVGYVRPGQAVEIKIESFPFTRHGTVPGAVLVVSGDAMQTPDADPTRKPPAASDQTSTGQTRESQGPVYSVRIRPLRTTIRVNGRDESLTPGMAVTAEIKTGKRRLIEYLLDPVMRYQAEIFRER